MGYLKYVKDAWQNNDKEFAEIRQARKIVWRKEEATVRIERPSRLDRARAAGYKAKQGFIVVRQRVSRGGRQHADIKGGRKTANSGQRKYVSKNYQQIAEEKVNRKFPNCEILNSYLLDSDGKYYWYEVIALDRTNPSVYLNRNTSWALDTRGKAYRGLTSSARKARGLKRKGVGAEKIRPSLNANKGRH